MTCSQRSGNATLADLTAAPDYFARARSVLQRLESMRERIHGVEVLRQATIAIGAEVAYLASFVGGQDHFDTDWLLLACDPRWCSEYIQHDWWTDDPWLRDTR